MTNAALLDRIDALESEGAVRRLAARYFRICDELGPNTPFGELGELFTKDALWEGKGRYAKAFGRYQGREAIVEMIRSYCEPEPHFSMTAHFLSSEDIEVDGDAATGRWLMLQTSDYTGGGADFRSASLALQFVRQEGHWRIAHFRTENIFSQQVARWNDEEPISVPDQTSDGAA